MAVIGPIPPPPGVTPDFVHPYTGGRHVVILAIAGIPIATLFLVMRLYTQIRIKRSFGSEDVNLLFAWLFAVVTEILIIIAYVQEGEGRHMWNLPLDKFASWQKACNVLIASTVVYVQALAFSKITLLLIFRRISKAKAHRAAISVVMAVVIGYSIALTLVLIFQCNPIARAWDVSIVTGSCINRPAVYVATASVNIGTDLAILLMPVPIVLGLKLPWVQKIGLALMFAVGSLTFVTSVIRLVTLFPLFDSLDQTWVIITPSMWIIIEANLLVICCCFISLKSFVRHYAPRLIGERFSYPENSFSITPRKTKLVIKKDISFNLSWQDETANRSRHSAGYVEMDNMKHEPNAREPASESQEVIIPPSIAEPPPVRKL